VAEETIVPSVHPAGKAGSLRRVSFHSDGNEKERTGTTLSVIVPAYNEQYLVEASLERLKVLGTSSLLQLVKVIVVDDGSKD